MRGISSAFGLVLILSGAILQAGVEPTPFLPQIRALEAIEHVLLVTYDKEDRLLSAPPEMQTPSGPLAVQFKAIRFHLALEESQIVRVVTPVLEGGLAPDAIIPALEAVNSAAEGIQNRAAEGFTYPVADPEVLEAVSGVESQAGSIVSTADAFQPSAVCPCWSEEEMALFTGDGPGESMCILSPSYLPGLFYLLAYAYQPDNPFCEDLPPDEPCEDYIEAYTRLFEGTYTCSFRHWEYSPELPPINRFLELTMEDYEVCAASVALQATKENWPTVGCEQ